jgi:hypothetical protein
VPRPVEYARLVQAIEQFTSQPTRDLPEPVLQKVKELSEALNEAAPSEPSPGMRQAHEAAGDGEAPTRHQKSNLSPGQRAARGVGSDEDWAGAAGRLAETLGGDGAQGSS